MLLSNLTQSSREPVRPVRPVRNDYSIGGKVFILGEYAVLAGLPAIVSAIGPRMRASAIGLNFGETHPHSPCGRLHAFAEQKGLERLNLKFEDPLAGRGGFGASTAQFALVYMAYGFDRSWASVVALYRQLMANQPLPPSGADLAVQWLGGMILFDPKQPDYQQIWSQMDWSNLLIFSTTHQSGRKTATHEHLAALAEQDWIGSQTSVHADLSAVLRQGMLAIENCNFSSLGECFHLYAEILHQTGLEVEATYEDRRVLARLPGVLGVKGTGAMQSDGILVCMEPGHSKKNVIQRAQDRGLRLMAEGLTYEKGLTF